MRGVSFHPRDRLFEPRIKFEQKQAWLRTYHTEERAARVYDVAARWLFGPNAITNFNDGQTLDWPTEAEIAGYLASSLPLSALIQRIPLETLHAAGVKQDLLIQAGAPVRAVASLPVAKT